MRSWRPFCCGWPGWMRSIVMPSRSHQTASLLKLKRPLGEEKRTPLSERMALGQAAFLKQALKSGKGCLFLDRLHGLAEQKITASMIGNGQGVTIPLIPQHELALVVGGPQSIRSASLG